MTIEGLSLRVDHLEGVSKAGKEYSFDKYILIIDGNEVPVVPAKEAEMFFRYLITSKKEKSAK